MQNVVSAARTAPLMVTLAVSVIGPSTIAAAATPSPAESFRLEAVEKTLPVGRETALAVRLINARSGKAVANAVVFRARLDMAPDGMGDMEAPLVAANSPDPAVYRFTTTLSMAGRWLMAVQAKVPGVTETVRAETIVTGVETPAGAAPPHRH